MSLRTGRTVKIEPHNYYGVLKCVHVRVFFCKVCNQKRPKEHMKSKCKTETHKYCTLIWNFSFNIKVQRKLTWKVPQSTYSSSATLFMFHASFHASCGRAAYSSFHTFSLYAKLILVGRLLMAWISCLL